MWRATGDIGTDDLALIPTLAGDVSQEPFTDAQATMIASVLDDLACRTACPSTTEILE